MSEHVKVSLDSANREQLFYFARSILNIEVGDGANNATVRAKIAQAAPGVTEITVPPVSAIPATEKTVTAIDLAPKGTGGASEKLTAHFRDDPKVEIMVHETADSTRAKEVQIAVQGDVIIIRRGVRVKIPYRHYLALEDGKEMIARDTDETNPVTGLPFKEWVDQHSYPFNTYAMPSAEEVAAWEQRVSGAVLS